MAIRNVIYCSWWKSEEIGKLLSPINIYDRLYIVNELPRHLCLLRSSISFPSFLWCFPFIPFVKCRPERRLQNSNGHSNNTTRWKADGKREWLCERKLRIVLWSGLRENHCGSFDARESETVEAVPLMDCGGENDLLDVPTARDKQWWCESMDIR